MNAPIAWFVELRVEPERIDDFRTLTTEMVAATHDEPGTLLYERYFTRPDRCFLYERYADSEAAVEHLARFNELFGQRFAALVKREQFIVLGDPSAELESIFARIGVEYATRIAGFAR
ncbi:MAG: antibiotic biosynthesis monooxygenase [Pirellulaceae bacterium]|jgi:quinol monooxygenase YgiN|nr:antibiotic biosynthesis monooxygenase [Pirellulaceae bacterium]MDP7017513.1 antibiotic biosynthesis monooxygenase [Pirellulaceae bacterium]